MFTHSVGVEDRFLRCVALLRVDALADDHFIQDGVSPRRVSDVAVGVGQGVLFANQRDLKDM